MTATRPARSANRTTDAREARSVCNNGPATSAIARLTRGNSRFAAGEPEHPRTDAELRSELAATVQQPFAIVLACSDSRVPVERLFDMGIGDLFVIRVAGNVVAENEIGSIEYAVAALGCPLVVVLGHRGCQAVRAAIEPPEGIPGIMTLARHIEPAIRRVRRAKPNHPADAILDDAVEENARLGVENLLSRSDLIRHRVMQENLEVIGAVYDMASGKVRWIE